LAGIAGVTVAAFNPTTTDAIVALPTTAAVTVAAYSPTPAGSPVGGVANVTATGYGPVADVLINAGLSNVVVAAYGPVPDVTGLPTDAAVVVAAYGPVPDVGALAGVAGVVVTAYNPTASDAIIAMPGVANVTVSAYQVTGPTPFVPPVVPGLAQADGGGRPRRLPPRKKDSDHNEEYVPRVPRPLLSDQYDKLLAMGEISIEEWVALWMVHGQLP
jgi:hypothetical protein